jgi:asparagine synthase (glutamine-hydrolysing)
MCGICGIYEPNSQSVVSRHVIQAMANTLSHRGPDEEGVYCGPGVGLGHRRLSIIDVSSGQQPLANEDESVWISFNGEIYNFEELNRTHLAAGHRFRTRSDTETIVHLYEELGDEFLTHLRGMFAIALWDSRRRRLVLARDRVGKKPLYYSWNGRQFVFGSEIKALWPAGGLSRDLDPEALSDYFSYLYVPAPKTIYRDVRKLRPAHYLVVDQNGIRELPYWDLRFDSVPDVSEEEWCERILDEYRTSVKIRLISEVPLGAFLSGGVDSSSVVALMNEVQNPVTTCSIGFTEAEYNEAEDARQFAQVMRSNHVEETVHPKVADILPRLAWFYDEPFADSSAVPTYYLSEAARRHVTVALSGDGGDESFAGYMRYAYELLQNRRRSLLPAALRRGVFGPLGSLYPQARWAPPRLRIKAALQNMAKSPLEGYFAIVSSCPPELKNRLLGGDVERSLNGYDSIDVLKHHYERAKTLDPLCRLQYVDIHTYLPDDILVKVDRASMAHSLEVRCPLLDHIFMELIAAIPSSLKLKGGQSKYIFKKALTSVLPSEILTRRKSGFRTPLQTWLRHELKEFSYDVLFGANDSYLNYGFLKDCWNQHQSGSADWSTLLWTALMFKTWQGVSKAA